MNKSEEEFIEKAAQRILIVQSAREDEGWGFDYLTRKRLIVGVMKETFEEIKNVGGREPG